MFNWPTLFLLHIFIAHFLSTENFAQSTLQTSTLLKMNNFRFEQFVFWKDFVFGGAQESRPLLEHSPLGIENVKALFGEDFLDYLTWTEKLLIRELYPTYFAVRRPQLLKGDGPLCELYFWIALPASRSLNFTALGKIAQEDFPFLGSASDGMAVNFSLSARSAILFMAFAQSKSHMDFPESDGVYDSEDDFQLYAIRFHTKRLLSGLTDGTLSLWNRRYLDYFLSSKDTLQLSLQEVEHTRVFSFNDFPVGKLVTLLNSELDEWKVPDFEGVDPNAQVHHWRHFHIPIHNDGVLSKLLSQEWEQDPSADALATLTRSISQLSLASAATTGSFMMVGEPLSPDVLDEASPDDTLQPTYFVTDFGARYHTLKDCSGMNGRPYHSVDFESIPKGRTLCQVCKAHGEWSAASSSTLVADQKKQKK